MAGRPAAEDDKRRVGGRYVLKELVGRGAMAQVYRAEDTLRGREVALKMVRHEVVENPTSAARFQREVKAASKLLHPNIVRVYEWGVDGGHAFIAMELIDGEDLFELIGQMGPLPQPLAVRITIDICKALALAHRKGVIHRDLKPENVMVLPGMPPRIKILDFGIAKLRPALSDDSWNDETAPRTITKTGTAVGTPSHMAPEQARGAPVDGRTDLYGVGVLLYEMLTGRLPFEGKNPVEIAIKHVREIPLPPQHHRPELHPRLNGLIVKTLAKSPSMRPSSADAMRATLETLLEELEREEEEEDDDDDDEMPMPTRVGVRPGVQRALAERGLATDDDDDDEGPTREHSVDSMNDPTEIPTQQESRTKLNRRMRARGEPDEEPVTLERASRMVPRIGEVIEDEPTVTFLEPDPESFKEESTRVIHAPPGLFAGDPETLDTITRERTTGPELPASGRISVTGLTRVSRPTHGPMGTLIRDPHEEADDERSERERRIAEAVASVGDPLLDDDDDDDEEELATEVAAPSPAALAVIEAARNAARAPRGAKTLDASPWPGSPPAPAPEPPSVVRPATAKTLQSAQLHDESTAPPPSYLPTLGTAASPGPPPPPPAPPGVVPTQAGGVSSEASWSPAAPNQAWPGPRAQTPSGAMPSAQTPSAQRPPANSAAPDGWVPFDPRATGGQMPAQQDLENILRQMPEPERHTGALIVVVVALIAAVGALVWALTL